MPLTHYLDRLLDLGPKDDPRRVAVKASKIAPKLQLIQRPDARVRIERTPWSGSYQLALLACMRQNLPITLVERQDATAALFLDSRKLTLEEFFKALPSM
jgi:hypothetical protein